MGRTSDAPDKLLGIAFDLIWEQSYTTASVDQICLRAKVRKGSFYHFFPSKSDLAVAAYERYWQQCRVEYDQIFSPQVPPLTRIERYCKMICDTQRNKLEETGRVLGCPFASLGSELSTLEEKVRQKLVEMVERMNCYVESALRDAHRHKLVPDQDFRAMAESVNAFVMGMLMEAKVRNTVVGLCRMYDTIEFMVGAKQVTAAMRN